MQTRGRVGGVACPGWATVIPCSTSPAVVPAAAATAAAAAVTEAGAVVCLLPTVKSQIPSHTWRKSYKARRKGMWEKGERGTRGKDGERVEWYLVRRWLTRSRIQQEVGWGKEITGEKQKGRRHTGLIRLEGGLIYIHRPLKAFL